MVELPKEQQGRAKQFEDDKEKAVANNYIDESTQMIELTTTTASTGSEEPQITRKGGTSTTGTGSTQSHGTGPTQSPGTEGPQPTGTGGPEPTQNGTGSKLNPPPKLWNTKKIIGLSTCAM